MNHKLTVAIALVLLATFMAQAPCNVLAFNRPMVFVRYYDPDAARADLYGVGVHAGGGAYTYNIYVNNYPYMQVGFGYNPGEVFLPLPPNTGTYIVYLAELYLAHETGIKSNTVFVNTNFETA